ncbi:hypothetical protein LY78DRAFT_45916 [Colletotrichum sublineola]|nr:hypothetical protein LY78DRAFT_45916 [Colletotrichum sublineola]
MGFAPSYALHLTSIETPSSSNSFHSLVCVSSHIDVDLSFPSPSVLSFSLFFCVLPFVLVLHVFLPCLLFTFFFFFSFSVHCPLLIVALVSGRDHNTLLLVQEQRPPYTRS